MTSTRDSDTRTRTRTFRDTGAQQAAVAYVQKQNTTCDGCGSLRAYPRPMCASEASPHFRTARETYHPRCTWFAVKTGQGVK